jgi:hypothetical protein
VRNGRAPDHMVMCHGKCSPHMVCYQCSVEGVDSSITTRCCGVLGRCHMEATAGFLVACLSRRYAGGAATGNMWPYSSRQRTKVHASSLVSLVGEGAGRRWRASGGRTVGIGQHWRDEGEDRRWLD